jgi:hypothetical protein
MIRWSIFWMVGRYLDGSRPVHASDLLEDAAGGVLKQRESLAVRDSLCLQLVLQNAKRGTTITAEKIVPQVYRWSEITYSRGICS